jgi:hypothetical protein
MKKLTTQVGSLWIEFAGVDYRHSQRMTDLFDRYACTTESNRLFRAAHAVRRLRDGTSIVGEQ